MNSGKSADLPGTSLMAAEHSFDPDDLQKGQPFLAYRDKEGVWTENRTPIPSTRPTIPEVTVFADDSFGVYGIVTDDGNGIVTGTDTDGLKLTGESGSLDYEVSKLPNGATPSKSTSAMERPRRPARSPPYPDSRTLRSSSWWGKTRNTRDYSPGSATPTRMGSEPQ